MLKNTLPLKTGVAILALLLATIPSKAQERGFRIFNTQDVRQFTKKQFPEYEEKIQEIEKSVSNFKSKADDNRVFRVPVVFHILGTDEQELPDKEQVKFQMEVLNQCFGRYQPEKKPYTNESIEKYEKMGDVAGIQFYVPANIGKLEGINVVKTGKKKYGIFNEIQNPKAGGLAAVDSRKVINIWIGDLDNNNAGYAHLPGAPGDLDGIVIDPDYFGNEKGTAKVPYTSGKTLVHLMGTYLGLYELWNDNNPCADDLVADTPPHSGPSFQISKEANNKVITMCYGYILAMYMNFMDNTDDEMLTLFTPGQKQRMRAMLAEGGLRSELIEK
jgi:hypothetical protein